MNRNCNPWPGPVPNTWTKPIPATSIRTKKKGETIIIITIPKRILKIKSERCLLDFVASLSPRRTYNLAKVDSEVVSPVILDVPPRLHSMTNEQLRSECKTD